MTYSESQYPPVNAPTRPTAAAQLLDLAETVAGSTAKMSIRIREQLAGIMRPEEVESAKPEVDPLEAEEWPPLFAELRRQLKRIDHQLGVIALDLTRVEL